MLRERGRLRAERLVVVVQDEEIEQAKRGQACQDREQADPGAPCLNDRRRLIGAGGGGTSATAEAAAARRDRQHATVPG
jgi:hypothetical protein